MGGLFSGVTPAVAKWPDQPEVKVHYTKSVEPFGDCWKQSMQAVDDVGYSLGYRYKHRPSNT